jgi:hypothetical protein
VREFVVAYAKALGCDESFLALPALAVLSEALANVRRIRLSETWFEHAIVWTVVVGDSGDRKSPAIDAATRPLRVWQEIAFQQHALRLVEFPKEVATYNDRSRAARQQMLPVPPRPVTPVAERYLVGDISVERLASMLERQRRGILVCRDELNGWLEGFGSACGGNGSQWLEFHGGRSVFIDRRGGNRGSIYVPNAAVCVTGGIPPETLATRLTRSQLANGLFARLLFAFPPPRKRHAPARAVVSQVTRAYSDVIAELLRLPYGLGRDGLIARETIDLTPDAQQRFDQFVEEFGEEQAQADPSMAASFAKLEGYAARFALILHMAQWASSHDVQPELCELASIEHGITLSRWSANEAHRVRALLNETPDDTEQRMLISWLHRHGGRATARELARSSTRRYAKADEANAGFDRLAEAGLGSWVERPTENDGGRPCRMFVLADSALTEGGCVGQESLCLTRLDGDET